MNRCPSCRDCLRFVGVRAIGATWERWSRSPICGLYVVADAVGATIAVTREEPKKGYFNGERS